MFVATTAVLDVVSHCLPKKLGSSSPFLLRQRVGISQQLFRNSHIDDACSHSHPYVVHVWIHLYIDQASVFGSTGTLTCPRPVIRLTPHPMPQAVYYAIYQANRQPAVV